MQDRYIGLFDYLRPFLAECGDFNVVACVEEGSETPGTYAGDLPVIGIIADEGDDEICIIRASSPGEADTVMKFRSFYAALESQFEKYPEYNLRVSEYRRLPDEYTMRLDIAIAGADVDPEDKVVRLFF